VTGVHYVDIKATISDADTPLVRLAINAVYPTPTARVGMLDIIEELRGLTDAGSNDYTVAGSPYWTDAQLQKSLDRFRTDLYADPLICVPTLTPTSTQYLTYRARHMNLESGTALVITDSTGGTAGTASYTVDALRGVITFTSTTGGSLYYVTGRAYSMEATAADIWGKKAAHYASTAFNFSTDNHSISREAIYQHCLERVQFYEQKGGNTLTSGDLERSDTNVSSTDID
jgi:hypothetical protein